MAEPSIGETLKSTDLASYVTELAMGLVKANVELRKRSKDLEGSTEMSFDITEGEIEARVALSTTESRTFGAEAGGTLFGVINVNAQYSQSFNYSVEGSSRILIKVKAKTRTLTGDGGGG